MGQAHPSTPAQRVQWTSYLLAHAGEYGVVSALSRATGVSRPTLYAWRDRAQQALLHALVPPPPSPLVVPPTLERQVLTLFVNAHASSRGIQHCCQYPPDSTNSLSAKLHTGSSAILHNLTASPQTFKFA